MNKRTGNNLTILLCSVTLTFFSGSAFSQNTAIEPLPDDCQAIDPPSSDAASMAARLSCYDHKLGNLNNVLSGLINERKRLNDVIGNFDTDSQQTLNTENNTQNNTQNSLANEQQQTIQKLQLERSELRAQLHRLLLDKQPAKLDKETDERLFRNYSESFTAVSTENNELRKLLAEFQQSATNSQATARILEGTNEQQTVQIAKLNDDITSLKLTVTNLSNHQNKLDDDIASAESRIAITNKQLLANAALIKTQQDNIVSLEESQIDNAAKLDAAAQELARVKDQNAETVGNLIATKEKLHNQISSLTEEQNQLNKQARQASLNSLATLSTRDKEISALSNELKDLNAAHGEVTVKLATTEQNLNAANEQLQASMATLSENDNKISMLGNELEFAKQGLIATEESYKTEISALNEKNDTINSDLGNQLQTRLTQVNSLQNERDRLAAELSAARPELVSLTKDKKEKNAEIINLTQTIASLESEIEQVNSRSSELKNKLTSSEKSNLTANEKVKSLTEAITALENILNESQDNNKQIESSLAAIKANLDASQKRLDDKQSQLQELIAERGALIAARNALTDESKKMAAEIEQKLKANGADSVLITRLNNNSLVLKVDSSQLFRTGSSRLSNDGQDLLSSVGNAISTIENRRIMIEGHSDNVPLGEKLTAIFKDNLGLSMARALSTAKFFTDIANIPANKMSVSGAGATKPLASNDTNEGRQINRRVEILLLPISAEPAAGLK